jgi:hypothetical protein
MMNPYEKLYFLGLTAIGVTVAVQSYAWQKKTNRSLRIALQNRLTQWRGWTSWRNHIVEAEFTETENTA